MWIVKIYIELSYRCNLKCKFCYAWDIQNISNFKVNYFDFKSEEEIILNLNKIFIDKDFIYDIDILWWESYLNNKIFFIISYIRNNFKVKNISLTTNWTLLNKNSILKLKESWISEFRISLHWLKKIHNFLVWKDVFDLVIKNLKYLSINNINFTLIFVYNNINKGEILNLILFLKKNFINIKKIFIEFVEISWFWLENIDILNILYNEKQSILFNKQLKYISEIFPDISIAISNYPKCKLNKVYHEIIDEVSTDNSWTVFYYPRLVRKLYKWFSEDQIKEISKKHFKLWYKIYYRKKIDIKYIINKCYECSFNKECFLLDEETILFDYLKFNFNKRLSYFQINNII